MRRLAFILSFALCIEARAEPVSRCGEAVAEWAGRASRDTDVDVTMAECGARIVRLRVSPRGAEPFDVAVEPDARTPFRAVGRLGVSPIMNVKYEDVEPARRDAYERLFAWIAAHPDAVRFDVREAESPERTIHSPPGFGLPAMHGPWLLLLAWVLVSRLRLRIVPDARRDALGLFILAIGLRLAFGRFGPFHVNGQGPMWIWGAAGLPGLLEPYGPGYVELFGPVGALFSTSPDRAVFLANLLLSASIPVLAFALGTIQGLSRGPALVAAIALASDPVSVDLASSETYLVPITALALATSTLLALARRELDEGTARRALVAALAAGLVAAQCARIHATSWPLLALTPLPLLAHGKLIHRSITPLVTGLVVGLVVLACDARWIFAIGPEAGGRDFVHEISWHASQDLASFELAAKVLPVVALLSWRRAGWAFAAVPSVFLALLLRHAYNQSPAWEAAYVRLFAPVAVLALAAAIPARLPFPRRLGLVLAAIAATILNDRSIPAPTTEQLEYAWLRERLATLPAGCRVWAVRRADDALRHLPDYVVPRGNEGAFLPRSAPPDLSETQRHCGRYVRSSLCALEGDRCGAYERDLPPMREVARTTLPAVSSSKGFRYTGASVDVVLMEPVRTP